MDDLVSVVMPVYNNSKYLSESIESILSQTYSNLELIITDDHSTDPEVLPIIKSFAGNDRRIRTVFLEVNQGSGVARNKCIEIANGRYIAFCDCDDRWMPDKLEKQIAFMREKNCTLCFSSYYECDEDNNICGVVIAPEHITFNELKHDNKIGCLTAVYDTKPYGKFYMPPIRKRQDWALFLTILQKCGHAYAVNGSLAYYRRSKNSISSNKLKLVKYNINVYQQLGYSKFAACMYFFFVFMPAYTRKVIANKINYRRYIKEK